MARAVVWSPCSPLAWASEVSCSRQDFFSGKSGDALRVRRPSVRSAGAALRSFSSSSEASSSSSWIGLQARCASSHPSSSAWSCSVNNRDTYAQRWVEESVHEIVRNIQEAPFLQYVFSCKGSRRQKISQEVLRNAEHWSPISESLSEVDPDAVILVQKVDPSESSCSLAGAFQSANGDGEGEGHEDEDRVYSPLQTEGAETNVWGVLVQARGEQANACYLLTTSRVLSSAGICTRYCLTRAKCCGPSYIDQLENAWLL